MNHTSFSIRFAWIMTLAAATALSAPSALAFAGGGHLGSVVDRGSSTADLLHPVAIFLPDQRKAVHDIAKSFPGIGQINRYPISGGTGTLIQKDLVLTAAHSYFKQKEIKGVFIPHFYKAWQYGQDTAIKSWKVGISEMHPRGNRAEASKDWALAKLTKPAIQKVQFQLEALSFEEIMELQKTTNLYLAGYSSDYANNTIPLVQSCQVLETESTEFGPDVFLTNCSAMRGSSGSPLFYRNQKTRLFHIVGIVSGGYEGHVDAYETRYGTRVTPVINFIDQIEDEIKTKKSRD